MNALLLICLIYICYNSKPLELDYELTLYWVIQENSIESSLQSSLSYIPIHMVYASYYVSYPKALCVRHEINM